MKKITLSIPEPCHEDWNKMTPLQQGRFCGSCQKEVIDFTAMTDDELFRFFAEKKSANVCGRTLPVQLNTPITKPAEHKKRKFWYISYLTSLLLFFSKSETKAQTKTPVTVSPIDQPLSLVGRVGTIQVKEERAGFVTGKVTDENGDPVPYASVVITKTGRGTSTNEQGRYKLKVNAGDILTVSAAGFASKNFTLGKSVSQNIILTRLRRDIQGEIVVVAGGISVCNSDDYAGQDQPLHIAQLYVKDNATNAPVANAQLDIVRNNQSKQKRRYTSSQGFYEMRNIKENDTYTITVSAIGYKEQSVTINGDEFRKRKMDRIILLEKQEKIKTMEEVVVTAVLNNPPAITNLADALAGKMGCGINVPVVQEKIMPLHSNPFKEFFNSAIKTTLPAEKAEAAETVSSIAAFPNPVTMGSSIRIIPVHMQDGNYLLTVNTASGEKIYSSPVYLAKSINSLTVNTAHVKNPGIYVIEMVSESGNKTACKLLVQ